MKVHHAQEIRWKGGEVDGQGEATNGDGEVMERTPEKRHDGEDEGTNARSGEEDQIGKERGKKCGIATKKQEEKES